MPIESSLPRLGALAADEDRVVGTQRPVIRNARPGASAIDNCGSITVRNGNCYLCHNCGNSMGCS